MSEAPTALPQVPAKTGVSVIAIVLALVSALLAFGVLRTQYPFMVVSSNFDIGMGASEEARLALTERNGPSQSIERHDYHDHWRRIVGPVAGLCRRSLLRCADSIGGWRCMGGRRRCSGWMDSSDGSTEHRTAIGYSQSDQRRRGTWIVVRFARCRSRVDGRWLYQELATDR